MTKYNEMAAAWWAGKLRNITPASFNNGDDSSSGGIAMMMAFFVADKRRPNSEQVDCFEKELAEEIERQVEKNGSIDISCDYAPDNLLTDIAIKHEIETGCFPWKTSMYVSKEKVTASCGYGRPSVTIYSKK